MQYLNNSHEFDNNTNRQFLCINFFLKLLKTDKKKKNMKRLEPFIVTRFLKRSDCMNFFDVDTIL